MTNTKHRNKEGYGENLIYFCFAAFNHAPIEFPFGSGAVAETGGGGLFCCDDDATTITGTEEDDPVAKGVTMLTDLVSAADAHL